MSADTIYTYLSARSPDPLSPADLIVGFGHFDLRIARYCGELWQQGLAPRILFTGGVGAGSADLDMPEAEAFARELEAACPRFSSENLLTEGNSTNTGENIRFSLPLLAAAGWEVRSAILVATPFRQRRVNQTWSRVTGGIPHQSAPPPSNLATDIDIFGQKGEDLRTQLPGEIDRLRSYPARGWIDDVPIPADVLSAITNL